MFRKKNIQWACTSALTWQECSYPDTSSYPGSWVIVRHKLTPTLIITLLNCKALPINNSSRMTHQETFFVAFSTRLNLYCSCNNLGNFFVHIHQHCWALFPGRVWCSFFGLLHCHKLRIMLGTYILRVPGYNVSYPGTRWWRVFGRVPGYLVNALAFTTIL